MTVRIFILDDEKPVLAAMAEGRLWNNLYWEPEENDPKEVVISLARTSDDGFDIIKHSEPFDIWLIDGDLGRSGDGARWVTQAFELYPSKVAKDIRSCSASLLSQASLPKLVERLRTGLDKAQ